MNSNRIIFFDFETGSKYPKRTQPTQLSAIAIDARTLSFTKNDIFNSEIKPILDDLEAMDKGLDPIQDEALEITGKTREKLAEAPELSVVFPKFVEFTRRYGSGGWKAPIAAGYNITNFDMIIIDRLAEEYGFVDKEYGKNNIFHPRDIWDLQKLLGMLTENMPGVHSLSMDSMRELFGFPQHGKAHDALYDCIEGSLLMIKVLNFFRRSLSKTKIEGSMSEARVMDYV